MQFISRQFAYFAPGESSRVLHAVAIAASCLVIGGAGAQPSHTGHTHDATAAVTASSAAAAAPRNYVTANAAGMLIALNRDTGKTRVLTADEALRLAEGIKALINQSTDGLVQIRHADGAVSMDLQGRFQNVMLARKEDDGSITQACVDNLDAAAAFFEIDPQLVGAMRNALARPWPAQLELR